MSKSRKSQESKDHQVNGTHDEAENPEVDSGFLHSRAPKDWTKREISSSGVAFSDQAVGPGTVGGMRQYY